MLHGLQKNWRVAEYEEGDQLQTYLIIQAKSDQGGSSMDGEQRMDLGSIFHIEWVRLANAWNELMNEIINDQSLKQGDLQ